jgi:uncharacterized protein (UPF0332 family)/predicted nucleotidyltransferase
MKRQGLKNLTPQERAAVHELIKRLRKKYRKRLVRVVLFGSKARGDAGAESDVDLLVVYKPNGADLKERIQKEEWEIGSNHSVFLEGLVMPESEFRELQKLRAPIYRSIRNEGYSLYPRVGKYSRAPLQVNGGVENVDKYKKIQIQIKWETSREALDDARANLEQKRYRTAASRAYYAVFVLATAVLFILDVVRTKHKGVQDAFSEIFVKTGRMEPEYADIFKRAYALRLEADYKDKLEKLTPESAAQDIADCEKFVRRMEAYLREVGALEGESDQ